MKTCYYCGRELTPPPPKKHTHAPSTATKDHVVPRCRDGMPAGARRLKVDCCYECNQDKGSLTGEEYRMVLAFRSGLVPKADILFHAERIEDTKVWEQ
jgi:hypothetical protein